MFTVDVTTHGKSVTAHQETQVLTYAFDSPSFPLQDLKDMTSDASNRVSAAQSAICGIALTPDGFPVFTITLDKAPEALPG